MTFFGPDIRNGLPIGLGSMAGFGRRAFTPSVLFAAGEQGFWYDPSDLSSMYQDSAGTTPVTAVEQAVGLILDKSKGLVLGGDLVTNGTFNTDTTGWTAVNTPTLSVGANGVTIQNNGTTSGILYQALTCVSGRTYQVSVKITHGGAGFARCESSTVIPASVGGTVINASASGTYSFVFVATATTMYIVIGNRNDNNASHTYDNISVREIAGNHAIQPTSASRPILRSRYNLLTYSEQFDAADWIKGNNGVGLAPVVTANAGTAPNGTATADRIQFDCGDASSSANRSRIQQGLTVISGQGMTGALWVKAFDAGNVGKTLRIIVESTATQVIHTLTADWALVTMPGTTVSTSINFLFETRGTFTTQTADVLVWGADLRRANDTYLPYQRIEAATVYDTVGFPVYLAFDGSDDSLYTGGNVDFSATDKMTVWAGVTKLADPSFGTIAELTADLNSNNGAFYVAGSVTASAVPRSYAAGSKGTTGQLALMTDNSLYPAPVTNVLTMQGDISGDSVLLYVDKVLAASGTGDQGTGNYANAPLYIGRRNNATLPFNGRVYALIGRGAATSAALITQAERWVAGKQGRAL